METLRLTPRPLRRLGIVMEPDPADVREAEGVLNPAARGPGGQLYLLPRLVAPGNFSRIGLARVVCDRQGDPVSMERRGVVLEPQDLSPYVDHVELRDDRTALFATALPARRYVYPYALHLTTPDLCHVLPAHAAQIYEPEVFGHTPEASFAVWQQSLYGRSRSLEESMVNHAQS